MSNHNDFIKDSSSILEEIEFQLNQALDKRRQEIEEELEEKISREKEEARKKISRMEEELSQDKQTLQDYRVVISEFDDTKKEIKLNIQSHLDTASQYQKEIETLTEKTLDELSKISDLHAKLEAAGKDAEEKIVNLRKDLQEKYGVTAELPDSSPGFSADFNLEAELEKLRKIKELLDLNGSQVDKYQISEADLSDLENQDYGAGEADETEKPPEPESALDWRSGLEDESEAIFPFPGETAAEGEESRPQPETETESANQGEEQKQEGIETEAGQADEEREVASSGSFLDKLKRFTSGKSENRVRVSETLEEYRKTEGGDDEEKVIYYEDQGNAILDWEQVLSVIEKCLAESGKLYDSLVNTESPKDQFFIKQKIIKQQESVRKFMLNCLRICEQKNCIFPEESRAFFNQDIMKDILERVSMENWSNQDDFDRFSLYINDLAKQSRDGIHSPEKFADTMIQGLRKGT
jgi:hypothetical protein